MKKTLIIITIIFACFTTMTGCKKFVDVGPPKTELLTSQAFLKDNSAISAVLGIYTNMQNDNDFITSGVTIYSGLSADEFTDYYQFSNTVQFQENQILPTNPRISSMWSSQYKNLALINTCIAGLQASTSLTPSVKAQLLGEAEFCRAFTYFYLVNLFGGVPLVTNVDYTQNASIAKSSTNDVYDRIIADLKDAEAQMGNTYPTSGRVRPNKWTATALLARVYLYVKDYANAEAEASAVIGSGTYGPLPALSSTFLKESTETIWQLLPISYYSATQEGYVFLADVPYGPDYCFTDDLLNSFEVGDNRKAEWIGSVKISDTTYSYPNKYKDLGQYLPATINENYVMLRLSEQYLIRAEARAQLNKLPGALADINVVRARAGFKTNLALTDQAAVLAAISNENRHEFFAEWGHRWLDLKRTGAANAVLSAKKQGWKPTAVLFPLPQDDLNLDKNLVQNPGY